MDEACLEVVQIEGMTKEPISRGEDEVSAGRELDRRNSRKSLPYFSKYILGNRDISKIHEDMWEFYLTKKAKGYTKFLFLIPRNHMKTTFWSVSFPMWQLLSNPDKRILIANAVWDNARAMLRSIKGHYDAGDRFRDLFGDWQGDIWTADQVLVSKRRDRIIKEPSITTAGVEKSVTSAHYDTMIWDDLVERVNVQSAAGRDMVKNWIQDSFSLLETGFDLRGRPKETEIICVGTRYDDDDAYGWLIDEMSADWAIYIRQVVEEGKIIFPEKFTWKRIEELKRECGSALFASNYYNDPVDEETAVFKRSTFQWVKDLKDVDPKEDNFYWIMSVDPAYGTSERVDRSGIVVSAFHIPTGNLYVRHSWAGRVGADGTAKKIIEFMKWWPQIKKVGLESNACQAGIGIAVRSLAAYHGISVPLVDLKPSMTGNAMASKEKRNTQALQPFIESKRIFFVGRHADLELELCRYPRGKTDDLVDALSYSVFLVPMGRAIIKKNKERKKVKFRSLTGYQSLPRR